jgi:hypothetical protein
LRAKNLGLDVATNLKVVEWLKADLVDSVAALFKSLLKAGSDATGDALATIIISCYVLGKRVGVNYQTIDMGIMHKINSSINEAHEIEQMYGDLTELQKYLDRKEAKKR